MAVYRRGGEVPCLGDGPTVLVAATGQAWDTLLLVCYASWETTRCRTEAQNVVVRPATIPPI